MFSLDFKEAFDAINHGLLLHKLGSYDIRGICLLWLQNFLSYSQQEILMNCEIGMGFEENGILPVIYFNSLGVDYFYVGDLSALSYVLLQLSEQRSPRKSFENGCCN